MEKVKEQYSMPRCDIEGLKSQIGQLKEENECLKKLNQRLQRTQARQFRDNQELQIKAEKAKDVVDFDKARKIKQLKELLKECRERIYDDRSEDFEEGRMEFLTKIDEVLK